MRQALERPGVVDYQVERHNSAWSDHWTRTQMTAMLIAQLRPESVIDPACGDATILLAANALVGVPRATLGDLSMPSVRSVQYAMPAAWTIRCAGLLSTLTDSPSSDLVLLTEVLEHIPEPELALRVARGRATRLIASSPAMRPHQTDDNPEHLWMFDEDGYVDMLRSEGWNPDVGTILRFPHLQYDFQIWVCR